MFKREQYPKVGAQCRLTRPKAPARLPLSGGAVQPRLSFRAWRICVSLFELPVLVACEGLKLVFRAKLWVRHATLNPHRQTASVAFWRRKASAIFARIGSCFWRDASPADLGTVPHLTPSQRGPYAPAQGTYCTKLTTSVNDNWSECHRPGAGHRGSMVWLRGGAGRGKAGFPNGEGDRCVVICV